MEKSPFNLLKNENQQAQEACVDLLSSVYPSLDIFSTNDGAMVSANAQGQRAISSLPEILDLKNENYRGYDIKKEMAPRIVKIDEDTSIYDIAREHLGLKDKKVIVLKEDQLIRQVAREICKVNGFRSIWQEARQGRELELPGHTKDGNLIRINSQGTTFEVQKDGQINVYRKDASELPSGGGDDYDTGPVKPLVFVEKAKDGHTTLWFDDGTKRDIMADSRGRVTKLTERNGDTWSKLDSSTWKLTDGASGAEVTRFHGKVYVDKTGNVSWVAPHGYVVLEKPDGSISTRKIVERANPAVSPGAIAPRESGSSNPAESRVTHSDSFTAKSSWYGPGFHGRRAANGSIFNQYELTAAHRNLPFGTVLEVSNPATGQSVHVKITDRGPYIKGRSLDLSQEAARRIGLLNSGVGQVQCRVVTPGARTARGR